MQTGSRNGKRNKTARLAAKKRGGKVQRLAAIAGRIRRPNCRRRHCLQHLHLHSFSRQPENGKQFFANIVIQQCQSECFRAALDVFACSEIVYDPPCILRQMYRAALCRFRENSWSPGSLASPSMAVFCHIILPFLLILALFPICKGLPVSECQSDL